MMAPMTSPSKTHPLKRWILAACLAVCFSLGASSISRADDGDLPDHDARLDGYATNMVLDSGGTGFTYVLLVVMGLGCLGVMFIKGKRTHLD
jgi:hypothetical protein